MEHQVQRIRLKTSKVYESDEEGAFAASGNLRRHRSESSIAATEGDEDDEDRKIELGPQCTLKEQLEKDKDDESLRRWKEQLLGSVDMNSVAESLEPDVKFISLAIKSAGRDDIVLPIAERGKPTGLWLLLGILLSSLFSCIAIYLTKPVKVGGL